MTGSVISRVPPSSGSPESIAFAAALGKSDCGNRSASSAHASAAPRVTAAGRDHERRREGPLPPLVVVQRTASGSRPFDVIVAFMKSEAELLRTLAPLAKRLAREGGLWVAWPKKASGVATDVTEGAVRARGLATGLVDNKVCAIDDVWSGLRFVYRLTDRTPASPKPPASKATARHSTPARRLT